MKEYSITEHKRRNVFFWLIVSSIMVVNAFIVLFGTHPWLVYLPMLEPGDAVLGVHGFSFAVFGSFYWLFDRYIWRWPLIRKVWLRIPDLNGTWIGTLNRVEHSDRNKTEEVDLPVILHVKQRYTRMSICLENTVPDSISGRTLSAASAIEVTGNEDTGYQIEHNFQFEQGFGAANLKYRKEENQAILEGDYVSSYPRTGRYFFKRIEPNHIIRDGYITRIQSRSGETYLALNLSRNILQKWIARTVSKVGFPKSELLLKNRAARDGRSHHITVVSPPEFQELDRKSIDAIEGYFCTFVLTGLGCVEKDGAESYFVTVTSPHIQMLRIKHDLPRKDLHVTIGFNPHDIHEVPKDETTWL